MRLSRTPQIVSHKDLCDPMKAWFQKMLDLIKHGSLSPKLDNSSANATAPKLKALLRDVISSHSSTCTSSPIDLRSVLDETRSIAEYDRYVKALAEVQYRADVLGSKRCSAIETQPDFQRVLLEFCSEHHAGMRSYLERYKNDQVTEQPVLGWAWWVREDQMVGATRKMQDFVPQVCSEFLSSESVVSLLWHKELTIRAL